MDTSLSELREQARSEKERLAIDQGKLERAIKRARKAREKLTAEIDRDTLRRYERIRGRTGGLAFVPAQRERCSACKMKVPHIVYTQLLKGQEILPCESCSRLLYWRGHFPEELEAKKKEPQPKAAPKKKVANEESAT